MRMADGTTKSPSDRRGKNGDSRSTRTESSSGRTARKNSRELQAATGGVLGQSARSRELGEGRLRSLGKSEADDGTPTDFALNPGGAPVKIDNRLYQSQTQSCSIR